MKFNKSLVVALVAWTATIGIAFSQTTNTNQTSDSTKTLTLKVKGITCSMDLKTISTNVEKLKGIGSCKAGKMGTTSSFIIIYNPYLVAEKDINTAIENTGGCEDPNDRPYKVKQ